MARVLVTGGSGFIGGHVVKALLEAGQEVRTTIRNPAREADVRTTLGLAGTPHLNRLSFAVADLEQDAGWAEATAGCDYVHHVASPFPLGNPADEQKLIRPAVTGTLRALKAARDARVKRTVVTSSFAAIGYGHPEREAPFTEADWTNPDGRDAQAYIRSKLFAEKAAWDFIAREGGGMELAVVNPVGVFGPALNADLSSSVGIVKALLNGRMPAVPRLWLGVVDVRDVADLHVRCMTDPAAAGERFLAVAGPVMSVHDIAVVLRAKLGQVAAKVPTRETPDWQIRLAALFSKQARQVLPSLGKRREMVADKARQVLGWSPRSNEEAITASAQSLMQLGLVG
jgi:dihydroflavonol-4-reductase